MFSSPNHGTLPLSSIPDFDGKHRWIHSTHRRGDRLIHEGIPYENEKRYVRKDGSVIWVHTSKSAIRDAAGVVRSLILIMIDITKRKQAEESLQQMNLHLESLVQNRTEQLRAANQSLRALSRRVLDIQEQERRAIARELHDRVGQELTAVNLNLTIIKGQLPDEYLERVGTRLTDAIHLLETTIPTVRNLISDLRPALLDELGLVEALRTTVKEFSSRYEIQTYFEEPESPLPPLNSSVEITLLRIAQEALINVAKHAHAKEVTLTLTLSASVIQLMVVDNGVGVDLVNTKDHFAGHGLTIMRERAEAVDGTFSISSELGAETKI